MAVEGSRARRASGAGCGANCSVAITERFLEPRARSSRPVLATPSAAARSRFFRESAARFRARSPPGRRRQRASAARARNASHGGSLVSDVEGADRGAARRENRDARDRLEHHLMHGSVGTERASPRALTATRGSRVSITSSAIGPRKTRRVLRPRRAAREVWIRETRRPRRVEKHEPTLGARQVDGVIG